MGHVYIDAEIVNPEKPDLEIEARCLVDSEATYTVIPRKTAEDLGLRVEGRRSVKTATGIEHLDESYARITIEGKSGVSTILISDSLDQTLIGVVTLEIIGHTIDPITGQLRGAEALLL